MLDMKQIEEEIERLEQTNCTSYSVCERLAILYIVRKFYKEPVEVKKTENSTRSSSLMSIPED